MYPTAIARLPMLALAVVFAGTLAMPAIAVMPDVAGGPVETHRPDELLVKFRPAATDADVEMLAKKYQAVKVDRFKRPRPHAHSPVDRWRLIRLAPGRDAATMLEQVGQEAAVEHVELNGIVTAQITPNDPSFVLLWGLNNSGQGGGIPDADIDAPEAWDNQTGTDATVVAVIDTGVDYTHPDLNANMWVNREEIPGNGVDDDLNDYVDDVYGYDFANQDGDPMDDHGHGTHCSGTIAAVGDNGIGVAGVNWNARIMAVKFLGASGSGTFADAVGAIVYATDNGARVMSNSWGGAGYSQALADAIEAANGAGVLFVAAAGNNASSNDTSPIYPANVDQPNVVAVAATDRNDLKASFSNYGATTVDLGAPGVDIYSTVSRTGAACCADPSGYRYLSGTSMATPHVSGAAALLLAAHPAYTVAQLKRLLSDSSDPIPAMSGITGTGGRLNVANALDCNPEGLGVRVYAPGPGFSVVRGTATPVMASVASCGVPIATNATVWTTFTNGDPVVVLYDDGAHGDGAAGDGLYGNTWTPQVTLGPVTLVTTATHQGSASDTRSGKVISVPPVARISPLEQEKRRGEMATLDGRGSNDPDGRIVKYQWNQTYNKDVKLSDPTAAVVKFQVPKSGSRYNYAYYFTLTVTADDGQTASAEAHVYVLP